MVVHVKMMLIVLWDPHVAMEAANRDKAADARN